MESSVETPIAAVCSSEWREEEELIRTTVLWPGMGGQRQMQCHRKEKTKGRPGRVS